VGGSIPSPATTIDASSSNGKTPDFGSGDAGSTPAGAATDDGLLYIERVDHKPTKNQNVTKFVVVLSDGREVSTIKTPLGTLAEQLCQDGDAVEVETKATKWGDDLLALRRQQAFIDIDHTEPIDDSKIPF
jgi:hypothetical protein